MDKMEIKYVSWLPGIIGLDHERFSVPYDGFTLENLMEALENRAGKYGTIFRNKNVIFASKNSHVIRSSDILDDSDVITFFSPIAGG
jgi:molybdopterin converting factor small subunit